MKNRHTTFYIKDIKPVEYCGETAFWELTLNGTYEVPFETQPTKGEHDYNNCEGCQKNLKELTEKLTLKFQGNEARPGFPLCCTGHSNLLNIKEFDRSSFVNVPEMVAHKIIYTMQHISNNIDSDNYYKDITDYIDYTVDSFGQMPANCGEPLFLSDYIGCIKIALNNQPEVPNERKNKLIEFLNGYQTPREKSKTDINILIDTYQKWLKIFPFEISFFNNLKEHFRRTIPILNGEPEVNRYSGVAKVKLHTKNSLIDVLMNLTNELLCQINSSILLQKGLLTEPQRVKLELILNERKLKLRQGYINNSPNEEQRYRKILKEWFADEKKFIDEITPLLNAQSSKIDTIMNKEEFLNIVREIGQLMPDNQVRKEYLENKLSHMGLSKESGYKSLNYYYEELRKARDGEQSIYHQNHGQIVHNKEKGNFGLVNDFGGVFKMTYTGFENLKSVIEAITQKNEKIKPELPIRLDQLFVSISAYKTIMDILVSQSLVHPNTYIWNDDKKGNKGYLASLIKDLHAKQYYKENVRPTNEQILAICKNTFGWDVGIDTIKHSKTSDYNFSFIPLASTIE